MQQQQAQLDQRALHLQKLMAQAPESLRNEVRDMVELSWIYHESALEGVVYAPAELAVAMRGGVPSDPIMTAAFDEIRQNKATIDLIRAWAAEKRTTVDADVVKDIYASLAPDEVDGKKPPAYRKDIPLHRLYFHEIAAPDKIIPKLKAFGQWINAPETRRTTHVLRLAAKAHFHLLHIYPYPKHSGKVARLVMNLLLLAAGYPPAVIHSTERQRYYDALKTNENALAQIVKEALTASIESSIRFLESRLPPPAPPPVKKIKLLSRKRTEPPTVPVVVKPAAKPVSRPVVAPMGVRPAAVGLVATSPKTSTQLRPPVASRPSAGPVVAKPAAKPVATTPVKPASAKPASAKPASAKPAPAKPASAKPVASKPIASKPPTAKAPRSKPRSAKSAKPAARAKPAKVVRVGKPARAAKAKVASLAKARRTATRARPAAKSGAKVLKPKARRAA